VTLAAAGWRSTSRSNDGQTILQAQPGRHYQATELRVWSGWPDSNRRPPAPKLNLVHRRGGLEESSRSAELVLCLQRAFRTCLDSSSLGSPHRLPTTKIRISIELEQPSLWDSGQDRPSPGPAGTRTRPGAEIARALFITTKTASAHLSRAYRKLDATRRSQLAEALVSKKPATGKHEAARAS